jgi:hypothetical protein
MRQRLVWDFIVGSAWYYFVYNGQVHFSGALISTLDLSAFLKISRRYATIRTLNVCDQRHPCDCIAVAEKLRERNVAE